MSDCSPNSGMPEFQIDAVRLRSATLISAIESGDLDATYSALVSLRACCDWIGQDVCNSLLRSPPPEECTSLLQTPAMDIATGCRDIRKAFPHTERSRLLQTAGGAW